MTGGTESITATVIPSSGGCYDSAASAVHVITSSNEGVVNIAPQAAGVYPNPAHNSVTVTGSISSLCLSNAIGQQLRYERVSGNKAVVDIAALPMGVYMLTIMEEDGEKVVSKIIKQ
jgi:hypothetical protein